MELIILKSKCVFDAVQDLPFSGYIVIDEGIISEVGKGVIPKKYEKSDAIVHDCGEKTVMPAFGDAHVHVYLGALFMSAVNVLQTQSEEDAAQKIYDYYRDRQEKWIVAYGWATYKWTPNIAPTKKSLDKHFPDKPVVVFNDETHSIWVNSKALKICNLNNQTADPVGGKLIRDELGDLTGVLLEPSAIKMVTDKLFSATSNEKEINAITEFVHKAHTYGITTMADVELFNSCRYDIYENLEKRGELDLRIFFSIGVDEDINTFLQLKQRFKSDRLSLLGAKGFMDGTPLAHTGYLLEEYSDVPGFFGEALLDYEWLISKAKALYEIDIPLRIHACGDKAVRTSLDVISEVQKITKKTKLRNTIEHIENIHPKDLKRFKKTGTIASIQPRHMVMDSITTHEIFDILGKERAKLAWPGKTLAENGAIVAFGTDHPIVALDPINTIYRAVNRVMNDKTPIEGWNPKEKFTINDALKNATAKVSYLVNMDEKLGTLEAGKLADIIVLNKNIFEIDAIEIDKMFVEKTIFEGRVVYEK